MSSPESTEQAQQEEQQQEQQEQQEQQQEEQQQQAQEGGQGEPLFADADPTQVELMAERIIVIDRDDNVLRPGSKKECHLNSNIRGGLLHRAFSLFLFDSQGRLLLQQRSPEKITFPLFWANTCCSHPLYTPEEMELENGLGVKRAAIRKLTHELGVPPGQLRVEDLTYITRLHYEAQQEGIWGEHEIDHVLIAQKDVDVAPVPNEVHAVRYVTPEELRDFVDNAEARGDLVSPWFAHFARDFLGTWWDALKEGRLQSVIDLDTIHRVDVSKPVPVPAVPAAPAAPAAEQEAS